MIEEGFHIPILIRAKDIKPEESWLNIIESNLGLPFSHTEDELLQALEAMVSHIGYEKKMLDDHLYVIPKVLIMVDGLDESDSQQRWIERIGEAQTITDSYSLIRFCFTSRPYAIPTNIGFAKVSNENIKVTDTAIYRISRVISDLQYTTRDRVVRVWYKGILDKPTEENGREIVSQLISLGEAESTK